MHTKGLHIPEKEVKRRKLSTAMKLPQQEGAEKYRWKKQ